MIGLFDLSPVERAKRYRELAEDALRRADESTERAPRQSYVLVAEQWRKRAVAIEQNILKYGTLYAQSGLSFERKAAQGPSQKSQGARHGLMNAQTCREESNLNLIKQLTLARAIEPIAS